MATTCYFEEAITDQDGATTMDVELGRSSYYSGAKLADGTTGEDSIYLTVNGESVIMTRAMAKKFVDAVASVARYHGLTA